MNGRTNILLEALTERQRGLWVYRRLAAQDGAHQRSVKHADLRRRGSLR